MQNTMKLKFFGGDGTHNYFRTKRDGGIVWDWSLQSPYESENRRKRSFRMENEKRLIDANAFIEELKQEDMRLYQQGHPGKSRSRTLSLCEVIDMIKGQKVVDAVYGVPQELRGAVAVLVEQYEKSKHCEYVKDAISHAMYHTWKRIDSKKGGNK